MPHLPFPAYHETLDGQRFGAHRPISVQACGGDAYFGTEAQFAAIGEAGGRVDHHYGRAQRVHEALSSGLVASSDHFGVVRAMAADVRDGIAEVGEPIIVVRSPFLFEVGEELQVRLDAREATVRVVGHRSDGMTELEIL